MKKKSYREAAILCAFLCVLFVLSINSKDTSSEQHTMHTIRDLAAEPGFVLGEAPVESPADPQQEACIQMALYIQEGFRIYGIEGSYEAYFGPIEQEGDICSCDILLEGADGLWSETLAYTYDAATDWYNFREGGRVYDLGDELYWAQEEPIFGGDSFWSYLGKLENDSSYAQDLKETAIYRTTVSQGADLGRPIRYYGKTGPVEHNDRFSVYRPERRPELAYDLLSYLYTYYDERMGIDIKVSYPQILYYGEPELSETVNETLRHVCFYDAPLDTEVEWNPVGEIYTNEERSYLITRMDEKYLSVRVYTYAFMRVNAHPGDHEYGVTIDMQTGLPVHLSDIVGEYQTMQALLDSGAFHPLGLWFASEEEWMEGLGRWAELWDTLDDYDHDFYLTDEGLGLITFSGNESINMEADYEDLGLSEFLP